MTDTPDTLYRKFKKGDDDAVLMWVVPVMTDERKVFRIFIGKHPCDDLPYIVGPDPDPRSPDFDPFRGIEGEDYSGWYVKEVSDGD